MLLLKLLRIKHWIKNIVIFLPLIFSFSFLNNQNIYNTVFATIAFCFIASAVYILNDIYDKKNDENHAIKKYRPIASGQISILHAIIIMILLLFLAGFFAFQINIKSVIIIFSYLLFNIFYSLCLKKIVILDVFCIAIFFLFRIFLGCVAINLFPSEYMILSTLFLSLLLGFSKRYLELKVSFDEKQTRQVLKSYNIDILKQFITLSATLSIIFYTMYTITSDVSARLNSAYVYLSVFPIAYFILRIMLLINLENDDDPSELFYKDKHIQISLLLYFLFIFGIIIFNNFI